LLVLGLPTFTAVSQGDPSTCGSTTNRTVGALDTWTAFADHCPDPRVVVDSGPSGATASTDASFAFHSPDGQGIYFECSLDGAAWQPCTSPQTYSGLAQGQHRFRVRAEYGWLPGEHGPISERVWNVDTVPPETQLDSGPSGTSSSRDAEFRFSSEAGATFQCRLDEGAWAACASPKTYSALYSRQHSFAVRAKDAAGNTDPTPATRSWLIEARSPDGPSDQPSISADGRYVAFRSAATDFTAGDRNDRDDIVVYDLPDSGAPQVMARVSVSSTGAPADGDSSSPSISADGRYVAFRSSASNLVSGDTNQHEDIFVHDRSTRATTRISVSSTGAQANSRSYSPSISGDGRYVAFSSDASNLAANDTNAVEDVFVHDRSTRATTRVSVSSNGAQANGVSASPSISGDGRYVAFESKASNLVTADTNATSDAFVRDRTGAVTTRVSVTPGGAQASRSSSKPSISGDGRHVAFESLSPLHASDSNQTSDIYVRDRSAGATTWVSAGADLSNNGRSYSSSISRNGRYVSFASDAPLHPDDANGVRDVYEIDLVSGTGTQISADDFIGRLGNDVSDSPSTSDAMRVAFASTASNFRACYPDYCDDNNLVEDVLIHEWVPPEDDPCGGGVCTTMAPDADSAQSAPEGAEPDCAAWGTPGSAQGAGDVSPLLVEGPKCLIRPAAPRKPAPVPVPPPPPEPGDDDYKPPPPIQPPQPPDECEPGEPPPSGEGEGDRHHIATNKSDTRPSRNADGTKGDPWTKRFKKDVFDKAGLSMSDGSNVVRVPSHNRSAHPHEYHREVHRRLRNAVDGAGQNASKARIREAVKEELRSLAEDILDPTDALNKAITKDNPDCPHGPVPWPF
jgi:Tol biopolymer transport system component